MMRVCIKMERHMEEGRKWKPIRTVDAMTLEEVESFGTVVRARLAKLQLEVARLAAKQTTRSIPYYMFCCIKDSLENFATARVTGQGHKSRQSLHIVETFCRDEIGRTEPCR